MVRFARRFPTGKKESSTSIVNIISLVARVLLLLTLARPTGCIRANEYLIYFDITMSLLEMRICNRRFDVPVETKSGSNEEKSVVKRYVR